MPFEAMAPKEYFPSQEAAEFGRWSNLDSPGGAAAKAWEAYFDPLDFSKFPVREAKAVDWWSTRPNFAGLTGWCQFPG